MNKTGIEYGELAWNFYPGCLHKPQGKCTVERCWAEGMSKRHRQDFHKPHLIPERLLDPLKRKKPARILVNFMGDLFGDWVDPNQQVDVDITDEYRGSLPMMIRATGKKSIANDTLAHWVLNAADRSPQHTFLFLTKNPAGIWPIEWPDNCWMGATAWDQRSFDDACAYLDATNAKHRWISLEPFLDRIDPYDSFLACHITWLVIGAQTNPTVDPKIEWLREMVDAAKDVGVRVWLKNNLFPMFKFCAFANNQGVTFQQEYPKISAVVA